VGQVQLINRYAEHFQKYNITCAQVLTTKENFRSRVHYLNMKNCFSTLNENDVIAIVNENDTISVTELMFTDNDELSGLIASLVNSEALIILSNIDGIYDGSPDLPESKVIEEIPVGTRLESKIISQKSNSWPGRDDYQVQHWKQSCGEGISVHIANGEKERVDRFNEYGKKVVNTAYAE
jgi:glutamate 5-kinase